MKELAKIISATTKPGKRAEVQAPHQELMGPRAIESDARRFVV